MTLRFRLLLLALGFCTPFCAMAQNVIWSEDFSNGIPSTWSQQGSSAGALWEYRGPNTNPNNSIGTRGGFYNSNIQNPIQSSSRNNGFVIFDSDYLDNAGSQFAGIGAAPAPHYGHLQTESIDLSNEALVQLRFESNFTLRYADVFILCSRDGGQSFPDTIPISHLQSGISSHNSLDIIQVNLSQYIGNCPTAVIAFFFEGRILGYNGLQGSYYWMLDDVELLEGPKNSLAFCPPQANKEAQQITIINRRGKETQLRNFPIRFARKFIAAASVVNNGQYPQPNVQLQITLNPVGLNPLITLKSAKIPILAPGDTLSFDTLNIHQDIPWHETEYSIDFKIFSDSIKGPDAPHKAIYQAFKISEDQIGPCPRTNLPLQKVKLYDGGPNSKNEFAVYFDLSQEDFQLSQGGKIALKAARFQVQGPGGGADSLRIRLFKESDFSPNNGINSGATPVIEDTIHSYPWLFKQKHIIDTGKYWLIAEYLDIPPNGLYASYSDFKHEGQVKPYFKSGSTWSQNWGTKPELSALPVYLITDEDSCRNYSVNPGVFCDTGLIYVPILNQYVNNSGTFYDSIVNGACPTYIQYLVTINRPHVDTLHRNTCGYLYTGPSGETYVGPGLHRDRVALHGQTCDSIYFINHTVNGDYLSNQKVSYCGSHYRLPWGQRVSQSGLYQHIVPGASGCDSVFLIDLDFTYVNTNTQVIAGGTGAQALAPNSFFQWVDCDQGYSPIPGAQQATFYPYYNGNFAVVVNNGICRDTSDCILLATNSLDQFQNEIIQVYPNPSQGSFIIKGLKSAPNQSWQILDMGGRLMTEGSLNAETEVSVSLAPGLYLLKIQSGDQSHFTRIQIRD